MASKVFCSHFSLLIAFWILKEKPANFWLYCFVTYNLEVNAFKKRIETKRSKIALTLQKLG
jgi:hypothetical protein